jgi:hypothetical protein
MNTMKRTATLALLGPALAIVVGCHASDQPLPGELSRPAVTLEGDEVPANLSWCQQRFGDRLDWPEPDALYGIEAQPEAVILVRDGEPLCQTDIGLLLQRPAEGVRGTRLHMLSEESEPGEPGEERYDSNPLPARDGTQEPGSGSSEVKDSNPLPAREGGSAHGSDSDHKEDSNPLPARAGSFELDDDRHYELTAFE